MTDVKKEINDVDTMLKNSKVFNGNIIKSSIDKNILPRLNMGYSSDGQMTSGYADAIEQLATSYNEATAEANALKMAQDGLSESTVNDILAKQNWSQSEREAALSSQAFKTAQQQATTATTMDTQATWKSVVATKALSAVKKAGSVIGGMAFAAAISVGISALVKFGDSLIVTKKELEEAAETAKQTIDEIKESFDNLESTTDSIKQRYAELAQGVDQLTGKNLTLSNDDYNEFLDLSNQLAELFPTLTKNYSDNGNAILDLSGDIHSIVSSLDDLIERQRQLAQEEILENLPSVYDNYASKLDGYTKQLEDAKKKQADYQKLYNQLNNAEYETSEDKKIVTFHFGNINEEDKAKLAQELTNSIEDINDYIVQDLGTLGDYDTTITLYLDKEFNGFEARLKSAQDEISKYTSKIEAETSSFNKYMNTWLQESWEYQQIDDPRMQQALQQVLFNKDWIDVAKSELGKDAKWKEISTWIEKKYIATINSINNKEIKQNFIDLFTLDLTPQVQIELAQKLQEYFNENNILVSLDFILDGEDPSSPQSLVDRMQKSISDLTVGDDRSAYELKKYTTGFDENQMNIWLEVIKGARNAGDAISKFEARMESLSKKDIEFFTENNLKGIDNYKDKIFDLGTYLESINSKHELSDDEIATLNTEYRIVADSVEEYKQKIIDLMNETVTDSEVMQTLAEAIESCDDAAEKERLQSLYDTLSKLSTETQKNTDEFGKLETAIVSLQSKAELLRDINEGIKEVGYIDSSKLDDIVSTYPALTDKVAEYNTGLITSKELFSELKSAYEKDEKNYKLAVAEKLKYNADFYNDVQNNIPQWLKDLAKSYGIDFDNYKDLCEAKLALDKEYARKKNALESARLASDKALKIAETSTGGVQLRDQAVSLDYYSNYLESEDNLEDFEKFLDDFDTILATTVSFDASWGSYGKDLGESNDKDKTSEIDWTEQSLTILQDKVDKFQTALDNTKGVNTQIEAIDNLNSALGELKDGYEFAYDDYQDRYEDALGLLSSNTESIRDKIESGEEFSLIEYDSDTAETIKNAIGYYNQMLDTKVKINDVTQQINENENVKKPQIKLVGYEAELDVINSLMDDISLTVVEQNRLLKKEKEIKAKILEQNLFLVETEEERIKLQQDYNKELKENERKQYENKRNAIGNRVNFYNSRVQDIQNEIDLAESIGEQGTEAQYNAMNAYLQKQIDYEQINYENALAKRDAAIWGTDEWNQYNDEIQEVQDNIHACTIAQIENNKAILLLPIKEYEELNEELQEELDLLNEYQNKVESAIGYASTLIQDQIDILNENKENISDYWDEQIEAVQKQKDELTESNDELQRQIDLENAKYNLEKAINNKTTRVKIYALYYSNVVLYISNYIG